MFENVLSFIDRHQSFILTTHDSPDADGLGSQAVMAAVLTKFGKDFRIVNSDPVPNYLKFLEGLTAAESWNAEKHTCLLENSAMLILDTSDEYHIGAMRGVLHKVKEVFVIDHHEPWPKSTLSGYIEPQAASTAEMVIELACSAGVALDQKTAIAAYTGIVFDSGFFAYPKTSLRTFASAMKTLEWGAAPNHIYRQLMENSSCAALLLQKQALANLQFYGGKKLAVLTLSMEDFQITGADFEDAESIVNIPLKAREVEVSILLKQKPTGEVRCSLRSKGTVNVSKVAQQFGGGGHATAAGFRSNLSIEETLQKLLAVTEPRLNGV